MAAHDGMKSQFFCSIMVLCLFIFSGELDRLGPTHLPQSTAGFTFLMQKKYKLYKYLVETGYGSPSSGLSLFAPRVFLQKSIRVEVRVEVCRAKIENRSQGRFPPTSPDTLLSLVKAPQPPFDSPS